jgi:secondary thiamine-phosphate synthase enzyme
MRTSAASHSHGTPPPPPRRPPRARWPRACGTLAEYRRAYPAVRGSECYKRFTDVREFTLQTHKHREFIDVTDRVQSLVHATGIVEGICLVFSPHTTAAVTINENADPDVVSDLLQVFEDVLGDEGRFQHAEGNSGGHALTSLVGPSVTLPIHRGALALGQWQAIFLCEFDGPRHRIVHVQVVGDRGDTGGTS